MIFAAGGNNQEHGFTITELLVAISVAAIASILMVIAYVNVYGNVIKEQTRVAMTQQSQQLLRKMTDDIREAQEVRTTNTLTDGYTPEPVGGWVTSAPANILVTTSSATDTNDTLIYDTSSGLPYQHEIIYFSNNNAMYRRLLENTNATGYVQNRTCPSGTSNCNPDIELVRNLDSLLFEFYDINGIATSVPEDARSVQITVNLSKRVYGQDITTNNITRVTLRNGN